MGIRSQIVQILAIAKNVGYALYLKVDIKNHFFLLSFLGDSNPVSKIKARYHKCLIITRIHNYFGQFLPLSCDKGEIFDTAHSSNYHVFTCISLYS